MRALHDLFRRTQLLIGLALAALSACGPGRGELAAARALDYLETTHHEVGADVALALRIYGRERDDARAFMVAAHVESRLHPRELARYGVLFQIEPTVLSSAELDPRLASGAPPSPDDEHDLIAPCLDEALACELSAACIEFVRERGRGGYVLTHQAVWLLFAHWMQCELPFDLERRRHEIAADLAVEMRHHPKPSELAYERMAMLAHLGFASAIEPEWIDAMLDVQDESGCWIFDEEVGCHPHPTAVALWTLAHVP